MTEIWSAERSLTPEEAEGIISMQFPQLAPLNINILGEGFDNTVFMVNKQYVFRFPRRKVAVELLETERKLLPQLVRMLKMPIPEPVFLGMPTTNYPWTFTGYKSVKGITPGVLTIEHRKQSAGALAEFLKSLHSFPVDQAHRLGVPFDEYYRLSIEKRKCRLEENIEKAIQGNLLPEQQNAIMEYANSLEDIKVSPIKMLVHGDLHFRNVVIDDEGLISGVIDWGDTHIGHPAVDLSIVYSFLPSDSRDQFFDIYGQIDEETQQLAQFKGIYTSLLLLLYGADKKNDELVAGAQESLALALS